MVADQLAEWLLPTPEIRSSNPNMAKFYLPIARLAELKLRRQEMARLIKKNEKRKKEI